MDITSLSFILIENQTVMRVSHNRYLQKIKLLTVINIMAVKVIIKVI